MYKWTVIYRTRKKRNDNKWNKWGITIYTTPIKKQKLIGTPYSTKRKVKVEKSTTNIKDIFEEEENPIYETQQNRDEKNYSEKQNGYHYALNPTTIKKNHRTE